MEEEQRIRKPKSKSREKLECKSIEKLYKVMTRTISIYYLCSLLFFICFLQCKAFVVVALTKQSNTNFNSVYSILCEDKMTIQKNASSINNNIKFIYIHGKHVFNAFAISILFLSLCPAFSHFLSQLSC